jgi:hypothetical protein
MTQRHYLEGVQESGDLDPQFKNLLTHHWMEEHQHAQLDTLMVEAIADGLAPDQIAQGVEGYMALGGFLDEGLKQQTLFDMAALEAATGRTLGPSERDSFIAVQHQANRWTYIGSGMSHPRFQETLERLSPRMREIVAGAAPAFS